METERDQQQLKINRKRCPMIDSGRKTGFSPKGPCAQEAHLISKVIDPKIAFIKKRKDEHLYILYILDI